MAACSACCVAAPTCWSWRNSAARRMSSDASDRPSRKTCAGFRSAASRPASSLKSDCWRANSSRPKTCARLNGAGAFEAGEFQRFVRDLRLLAVEMPNGVLQAGLLLEGDLGAKLVLPLPELFVGVGQVVFGGLGVLACRRRRAAARRGFRLLHFLGGFISGVGRLLLPADVPSGGPIAAFLGEFALARRAKP